MRLLFNGFHYPVLIAQAFDGIFGKICFFLSDLDAKFAAYYDVVLKFYK